MPNYASLGTERLKESEGMGMDETTTTINITSPQDTMTLWNRCDKCGRQRLSTIYNVGGINYCAECYHAFYGFLSQVCPLCGKPLG